MGTRGCLGGGEERGDDRRRQRLDLGPVVGAGEPPDQGSNVPLVLLAGVLAAAVRSELNLELAGGRLEVHGPMHVGLGAHIKWSPIRWRRIEFRARIREMYRDSPLKHRWSTVSAAGLARVLAGLGAGRRSGR